MVRPRSTYRCLRPCTLPYLTLWTTGRARLSASGSIGNGDVAFDTTRGIS